MSLIPTNVPAKPEPEELPEINWERAFKVLCAALAREMISSTALYFVLLRVRDVCGDAVVQVAAEHMALNRDKGTQDFMG